ncbi:uncharacterized protein KIAA1958-like [Dreissena polymorpha]|nr:uncharacterized protein KIAA1958-like [Dreissena polymorpha]
MKELDNILCMFILSIRKENGDEYETTSLRSFVSSIDKELQLNNYQFTIAKGQRQGFPRFRETLSSKMKKVKKEGKGNKANAAQPIEQHEIQKLYDEGQLGNGSPQAIINSLWFRFTTNFGMRSVEEHYNLRWGDVKLCRDVEGDEYLELVERQTKTRTGATDEARTVPPRIWANDEDPSKCVVATYRIYASKRPHRFSEPSDPFYLSTSTKANITATTGNEQWFISMKMGI